MDNRIFQANAAVTPPSAPAAPSSGYPTNGDPLTSVPATQPGEFWFHQIGEELRAIVVAAGLAPSTTSTDQVLEAIQRLIDAQSGNYALDTGVVNSYIVAMNPVVVVYTDGMTIRVKAVNANTGATSIDAGGGVVDLVNDVGGALVSGDIPAGSIFSATYIAPAGKFYINSLVQSQGDARYAGIAQVHYVGTTPIAANRASAAQVLNGVNIGFPATQNASADPNTLDDYEEGSFTPTLGGTATYGYVVGQYTKIGRECLYGLSLGVSAIGTGSTFLIGGMPFSLANAFGGYLSTSCAVHYAGLALAVTHVVGLIGSSYPTSIALYSSSAISISIGTGAILQNGSSVTMGGSFITNN